MRWFMRVKYYAEAKVLLCSHLSKALGLYSQPINIESIYGAYLNDGNAIQQLRCIISRSLSNLHKLFRETSVKACEFSKIR
ncbi:hypothetical protein VCRA2114E365_50265 [Vibrio crassostreae]|nr:hypothetical protein VCRA2113O357_50002 [Vibrio crassostreae]CAK2135136.1 hypothetical protein VCRA2113O363_50002 [Vibrio crassostreae]CAK2139052.1 hypothetical protein VCRA2113O359_50002 [Vibrio crassostreae]CAK2139094.1 hypothetical protein VCRA2114O367_50002 [Vibrio crassostreae]CAK2139655.1 hypothetical protein VCRA2113O354_50002 [Vibrio crassostreae]